MKGRVLGGNLAAAAAYTIFGLNIVFCKDISNANIISPVSLFTLRSVGAGILFWLLAFFLPKERMSRKDLGLTALASFLGFFTTQLTFLFGIRQTTSIDVALMSTLSPIFTMFVAAVAIKEPVTWKKAGGVALSFFGIILLILNSVHVPGTVEHTTPLGFVLIFFNVLSFSMYLGIFRPLINRYGVVTFMKWIFLFSSIYIIPFSARDLMTVNWSAMSASVTLEILYLVVFATFIAYFLIPVAQKRVRPTIVCLYTYLQPLIACVVSIYAGIDHLTWQKTIAAILVIGGVAVVNSSRSLKQNH